MSTLLSQVSENLSFVLTCLALVVGLALLAKLAEHFLPECRKVTPARRVSIIGICAALAAVLHMLDFPLPFLAPGFYKLDFSELPVLLCGFYLGPCATVICESVKILLKLLLKGTSTAFVGDLANFVVGCSFVLPPDGRSISTAPTISTSRGYLYFSNRFLSPSIAFTRRRAIPARSPVFQARALSLHSALDLRRQGRGMRSPRLRDTRSRPYSMQP